MQPWCSTKIGVTQMSSASVFHWAAKNVSFGGGKQGPGLRCTHWTPTTGRITYLSQERLISQAVALVLPTTSIKNSYSLRWEYFCSVPIFELFLNCLIFEHYKYNVLVLCYCVFCGFWNTVIVAHESCTLQNSSMTTGLLRLEIRVSLFLKTL